MYFVVIKTYCPSIHEQCMFFFFVFFFYSASIFFILWRNYVVLKCYMLQPVIYFSETFLANFLIFSKLNKGKDKTLPYMSSAKYLKKESDIKQEGTKGDWSRSRENSRRRYSRSRSRSRDRSRNYDRNSSHERRDSQYRYKHSQSKERGERSQRNRSRSGERSSQSKERGERSRRSRSRSGERSSQSARKRNRSPAEKCDRYAKQSSIKDPSDKKKARSPDNLEVELLRKRRELMELNELIARKKAIVAMEHNAKKVEPEDGKSGVTNIWLWACASWEHLDAWPKNQGSPSWRNSLNLTLILNFRFVSIWAPGFCFIFYFLTFTLLSLIFSKASPSMETAAPFVKSESQEMQIGYHQQTFASNTPGYSTFESIAERTLTTAGSERASLTQIKDSELVRKRSN